MPETPERVLLRLDWRVIRRLDGLLQGDYRSLFYGFGVDFADLREYQAEDREISAWFLLDLSPSVDFGTMQNQEGKRAMLLDFVAVLARLLTRHGNRVGAMMFGNGLQKTVPARGGKMHVLRLIHEMQKQPHLPQAPFTDLRLFLKGALNSIRRRSLVFVISDFISAPGWESALSLLSQRHEVIAVRLYDPAEMDLPDVGVMVMEDAETGGQLYVDTHDKKFRKRYQEAMQLRETDLKNAFKRSGVDVLPLSTQDDIVRSIVRFAKRRQQMRR